MREKYEHFSSEERYVLSSYLKDGLSLRKITEKIKRSVSTLSYEIQENSRDGTKTGYDPVFADFQARLRKWDANSHNPLKDREIWAFVLGNLQKRWSPQQIAGRLKEIYPNERKKHVSHETIYRFINSKEGRELGLHQNLRRRKLRKVKALHVSQSPKKETIPNRIPISKRPIIVGKKGRYGDWESDTMEGTRKTKASLTVQKERKSQYVCVTKIKDKSSIGTITAMEKRFQQFPKKILITVTFDNGRENTEHQQLQKKFGMDTYFCDPYCSWQKGSVENIIGLIRDYLPKGTDLEKVSEDEILAIQNALNNRPRKCLGYLTPNEVLSKQLKKLGVRLPM